VGPAMSFLTSFCDFPQKEHCKLPWLSSRLLSTSNYLPIFFLLQTV
jgi:hypothetical protein